MLLPDRFRRKFFNAEVIHTIHKYPDTTHGDDDNYVVEVSTKCKPDKFIQVLFHVSECQADSLINRVSLFLDSE